MKVLKTVGIFISIGISLVCNAQITKTNTLKTAEKAPFEYVVEQFSDIKVLRYQIPGWENLTLKENSLLWWRESHLSLNFPCYTLSMHIH